VDCSLVCRQYRLTPGVQCPVFGSWVALVAAAAAAVAAAVSLPFSRHRRTGC